MTEPRLGFAPVMLQTRLIKDSLGKWVKWADTVEAGYRRVKRFFGSGVRVESNSPARAGKASKPVLDGERRVTLLELPALARDGCHHGNGSVIR
jgi:hypothetical protein